MKVLLGSDKTSIVTNKQHHIFVVFTKARHVKVLVGLINYEWCSPCSNKLSACCVHVIGAYVKNMVSLNTSIPRKSRVRRFSLVILKNYQDSIFFKKEII